MRIFSYKRINELRTYIFREVEIFIVTPSNCMGRNVFDILLGTCVASKAPMFPLVLICFQAVPYT